MSYFTLNFESEYLMNNTEVGVVLPDRPRNIPSEQFYRSGKKYKVLWLLHGTYGDYSDWFRHTMIESYVRKRELIVVSFSAMNSNYSNWPTFGTGYNAYDFLFKELMPVIYGWLPASDKPEDNYIAGLSMGGFGASLYAFNHPEKFAGAAILSAYPQDLRKIKEKGGSHWERFKKSAINYASEEDYLNGYENTVEVLRKNLKEGVKMPKLFFACGEDDFLYENFCEFRKLDEEELHTGGRYFTLPGLRHEWKFWDEAIHEALDYFGIHEPARSQVKF